MSEFTPLREAVDNLASRSLSPDFVEVKRRATRRGRRRVAVAAAGAVAFIAVSGGLAAGNLGASDQPSPIGEPTTPSSESPTVQENAEASPNQLIESFTAQARRTLAQEPDWAATGSDALLFGACQGNWSGTAGGSGGSISITSASGPPYAWHDVIWFRSSAEASNGVVRLLENLASCQEVAWRTQSIGQTNAVLVSSAQGVAWIHQKGDTVTTFQVPTVDGPPSLDVQIDVADLLWTSIQ